MLTAESARHHLDYDPHSGRLTWRVPRAQRVKAGDEAGSINGQGYRDLRLFNRTYPAHRIAWLICHGCMPAGQIDHINGDRSDNRISNLREVTSQENTQNQRVARKDNKHAGLIGAGFHKASGKFRARIGLANGRQQHLGLFDTAQAAHQAYLQAKRNLHAGCTI